MAGNYDNGDREDGSTPGGGSAGTSIGTGERWRKMGAVPQVPWRGQGRTAHLFVVRPCLSPQAGKHPCVEGVVDDARLAWRMMWAVLQVPWQGRGGTAQLFKVKFGPRPWPRKHPRVEESVEEAGLAQRMVWMVQRVPKQKGRGGAASQFMVYLSMRPSAHSACDFWHLAFAWFGSALGLAHLPSAWLLVGLSRLGYWLGSLRSIV